MYILVFNCVPTVRCMSSRTFMPRLRKRSTTLSRDISTGEAKRETEIEGERGGGGGGGRQ